MKLGAIHTEVYTTIQASVFTGNKAGHGGATTICFAQINDSHFESNTASRAGGALSIFTSGCEAYLSHLNFTLNEALVIGGAIAGQTNTTIFCIHCLFYKNGAGIR